MTIKTEPALNILQQAIGAIGSAYLIFLDLGDEGGKLDADAQLCNMDRIAQCNNEIIASDKLFSSIYLTYFKSYGKDTALSVAFHKSGNDLSFAAEISRKQHEKVNF